MIIAESLALLFLIRAFTEACVWLAAAVLAVVAVAVFWEALHDRAAKGYALGAALWACGACYSIANALLPARVVIAQGMCAYWRAGAGSGDDIQPWQGDWRWTCTRCGRETPIEYCERGPCPMALVHG